MAELVDSICRLLDAPARTMPEMIRPPPGGVMPQAGLVAHVPHRKSECGSEILDSRGRPTGAGHLHAGQWRGRDWLPCRPGPRPVQAEAVELRTGTCRDTAAWVAGGRWQCPPPGRSAPVWQGGAWLDKRNSTACCGTWTALRTRPPWRQRPAMAFRWPSPAPPRRSGRCPALCVAGRVTERCRQPASPNHQSVQRGQTCRRPGADPGRPHRAGFGPDDR